MPTQPFEFLLNRDRSSVPSMIVEVLSPSLQEAINYATNLYQRCQTSTEGEPDKSYPILASYLHIIQMTDSIEVLISNGCSGPANLLLRSAFEARLAIEYMLEKNTKQRALSWMVRNMVDTMQDFENADPSDLKGKEYKSLFAQGVAHLPPLPNLPEAASRIKEDLKKSPYAEVYEEYATLCSSGRRYPEWYSFFQGPRNLKELAYYLHHEDIYQRLYASWSRISHASDMTHLTLPLEDGTSVLGPIRNPINSVHIGTMVLSMLIEVMRLVMDKYRPYESSKFQRWYQSELQERHLALVRLELDHLNWQYKTFIQKKQED